MLKSHLIRLIKVDSEVDSAANSMLLPGGSGGTPLLWAFMASFVRLGKILWLYHIGCFFYAVTHSNSL